MIETDKGKVDGRTDGSIDEHITGILLFKLSLDRRDSFHEVLL